MKKIYILIAVVGLALTGLLLPNSISTQAQSQITTVFSSTQTVLRRDNGQPLYYLTGDEIADDAIFVGQRRITSFTFAYQASVPVNATYRFYHNDLNAPLTDEGRIRQRGLLVKEITETNLPAGNQMRTVNLPTEQQFVWGTPPDLVFGPNRGGGGYFSVQFTDVNGNNSGTAAGTLLTRPGASIPINQDFFLNYSSDGGIYNVSQSDRGILESEFYPLPSVPLVDQLLGLYFQVSGINVTPPLVFPTPNPNPTPTANPTLTDISLSQTSVRPRTPVTGTVTLSAPSANGTTVALSSSSTDAATVPASVTVAPGASRATFPVTTSTRRINNATVITARLGNTSRQISLFITRR